MPARMSRARPWATAISIRMIPSSSPMMPNAARVGRYSRRCCATGPPASFRARFWSSPARRRPTATRSASRFCSMMTASSSPSRSWRFTPMTWPARMARPRARSTRMRFTTCVRGACRSRWRPIFWCCRFSPRRSRRSLRRACATRSRRGLRAGWSGGAADAGHARHRRHLSGAAPGGAAPAGYGAARGSRAGDADRRLHGGVRRAMATAGARGASDRTGPEPAPRGRAHGLDIHRAVAALCAGAFEPRDRAAHRRARHCLWCAAGALLGVPGGKPAHPAARAGGRVHRAGARFAGCRADLVWCFRLVLDIRAARGGMERVMTSEAFWSLVRQTLFEPREAAQALMAMRLPQAVLWQALALMSVLYTILYSLSLRLSPPADPSQMLIPALMEAPLVLAAALFGGLALTVIALR